MNDFGLPIADDFERLLGRLEERHGICRVDPEALDAFAAVEGDSVVLLTDTPQRCPEAWDLAVVLPEILSVFASRVRAGVADPQASAPIAARFGVGRFPALLFQRGGHYVGVIEGMRDWSGFGASVAAMLAAPVSRAPGIGIPLRPAASSPSCH